MLCVSLTGCNEWKNYFHTEASLSRVAEKSLEEKYNEEFIIHDVWDKSQGTFFAVCSPKADEEIVFELVAWKDGSGLCHDEYEQAILANYIGEEIKAKVLKTYSSCLVGVSLFVGQDISEPPYNGSLEKYLSKSTGVVCGVSIYVNSDNLDDEQTVSIYDRQ